MEDKGSKGQLSSSIQETGLRLLNDKLAKGEFDRCIDIANSMLAALFSGKSDSADLRQTQVQCLIALGDAHYGLSKFDDALDDYELARKARESYFDLLSDDAFEILYRIERVLNTLASREKISGADEDMKDLLTATFVTKTAQNSNKLTELRSKISSDEERELTRLWAQGLEKKEKSDTNSSSITTQKKPIKPSWRH